ncbi:YdcF family protein [Hymenobacter metallilatus]|uniref:YdcF family protein n=1 Tax=Hymenobacter metallilatus TaxID=2493666 RepID=A0A3R9M7N4_9BACT|nr:YdcF family protein [Hymenobacter metallilatus]RSK34489.1 YdcF family protein [Hymenobacter metallilatus]
MRLSLWRRLTGGVFLLLIFHATGITLDALTDQARPADCLVVPGNTVNPDGSLSPRLEARLDEALRLYRAGVSRYIFVSGGLGKEGYYEGSAMRRYLLQQGVPNTAIYTDNQGNNTLATARNFTQLARTQQWKSAVVVSQFFHLSRTKLLLRQQGVAEVSGSAARYIEVRDGYALLREIPALYAAWLR